MKIQKDLAKYGKKGVVKINQDLNKGVGYSMAHARANARKGRSMVLKGMAASFLAYKGVQAARLIKRASPFVKQYMNAMKDLSYAAEFSKPFVDTTGTILKETRRLF